MSKDYSLEYYTPEPLPDELKNLDISYTEEEWNALPNELRLRLIASGKFGWDNEDLIKAADEIERLREALRFYSSFADAPPQANISPLMFDRGNKARAALKEGE
jgi:hypothetical protein